MAKVLLIDDSRSALEAIKAMLEAQGHEVTALASAAGDLSRWLTSECALVITDIYMPERDGIEVIREIRSLRPAMPVIAMSGKRGQLDMLHVADLLGASAVLSKPFTEEQLVACIDSVLNSNPGKRS